MLKQIPFYRLCSFLSETVKRFLPFFLRDASTRLPLGVDMRSRNPCLFLRFLTDGWYVLFMMN